MPGSLLGGTLRSPCSAASGFPLKPVEGLALTATQLMADRRQGLQALCPWGDNCEVCLHGPSEVPQDKQFTNPTLAFLPSCLTHGCHLGSAPTHDGPRLLASDSASRGPKLKPKKIHTGKKIKWKREW